MRLDKFICHSTGLSRQATQRAVRAGAVLVNGVLVKKADHKVVASDVVKLDGETIVLPGFRYIMLNKPSGYICANRDLDTTGLVLITNDGDWNHRVTAPSRLCCKTYCVTLTEPLLSVAAEQLRAGVLLTGEKKLTQPATLSFIDNDLAQVRLSIHEGKYHQVKRMFAAVGNHVAALHRESIGDITLDPALLPGQYRALTEREIASIR